MSKKLWTAVDQYIDENLHPSDPILEEALRANSAASLPSIDVAPNQGKFLHLLAKIQGAIRILEIGTLGGYSTIWLARALPSDPDSKARLITLEVSPEHAKVARSNIDRAGLTPLVELRLGPALDSLAQLHREQTPPFDLIFIDADKPNLAAYLDWSLKLSRAGTVILCDNVIRKGAVIKPQDDDPAVQGARRLFENLKAHPHLDATSLQTVGSKGHDGFVLAIVKSTP
jgi:predicted O-methyltransferase YrrM